MTHTTGMPGKSKNDKSVIVLGATGMLGSTVAETISKDVALELEVTSRKQLDAETATAEGIAELLTDQDWAINAIGVIKPFIHDQGVERALRVNSLFPFALADAAEWVGCRVIQIATDCVYSGAEGGYTEHRPHDALDVYGKTKSLGEVRSLQVGHLRCSIIGPELRHHVSLMDWLLYHPPGDVSGFTNHHWNGVTTHHFAKVCAGIVKHNIELPHIHHLVPEGVVTKAELLGLIAKYGGREDLAIIPREAETAVDRTLATNQAALNRRLWAAAGYDAPPTVEEMLGELGVGEKVAA